MSVLFDWTPDDTVARRVSTRTQTEWDSLASFYTRGDPRRSRQLNRVIEIAQQHGVVNVVVEPRYIDLDWRSENAAFYSTTFMRYPTVAHRVHFFVEPVPDDLVDLSGLQGAYRGYSVLRPLPSAPVGRTMIAPPPELDDAVRVEAAEDVDLVGWPFRVCAMPFVSQDANYMRCAHASMWMTLLHAHFRHGLARRVPAEIHDAALGGVIVDRQVPSEGLSLHQMLGALNVLGLSPGVLPLKQSRVDDSAAPRRLRLYDILARYVNSNLPTIIVSQSHAWTIVAYTRQPSAGHPGITLYRHDDAVGPYIRVDDPWNESNSAHSPWTSALLCLPPKIYMTSERAELIGRWWFDLWVGSSTTGDPIFDAHAAGELTFRVYGLRSRDYKHGLVHRPNFDPDVAREYRLSQWPRSIWVVEAVDRRLRTAAQPDVLGEVLIDPTSNQDPSPEEPGILAVHAPGVYFSLGPDYGTERRVTVGTSAYETGRFAVT